MDRPIKLYNKSKTFIKPTANQVKEETDSLKGLGQKNPKAGIKFMLPHSKTLPPRSLTFPMDTSTLSQSTKKMSSHRHVDRGDVDSCSPSCSYTNKRDAAELMRTTPSRPEIADIGKQMNELVNEGLFRRWRWPPYLLILSVVVLMASHTIHCLAAVLTSGLPHLRHICQLLKSLIEERISNENEFAHPVQKFKVFLLAALMVIAYVAYFSVYVIQVMTNWSIQPLWSDMYYENDKVGIHSCQNIRGSCNVTCNNSNAEDKIEEVKPRVTADTDSTF